MLKPGLRPQTQLFAPMECREDALRYIKGLSWIYFGVAALNLWRAIEFAGTGWFDAIFCVTAGFLLRRYHSRVLAGFLCLMTLANLLYLLNLSLHITGPSGVMVIISGLMFCLTLRVLEATIKLHGRFAKEAASAVDAPKD